MNNGASYLEIIHVRLAAGWPETLIADLQRSIAVRSTGSDFRIFSRVGLEGDIAIHIVRTASAESSRMSSLGLGLASEFRDLGMVEHSLWVENAL